MTKYVALLRAVNVGGSGSLRMTTLRSICADAGFHRIETYIASGNVVFDSEDDPATVHVKLQKRLQACTGQPIGVFVRTGAELRTILRANPFRGKDPGRSYVFFLSDKAPRDCVAGAVHRSDELIEVHGREIFVHYPSGMGRSKLRIPAASFATARNLNTVTKLVAMSS